MLIQGNIGSFFYIMCLFFDVKTKITPVQLLFILRKSIPCHADVQKLSTMVRS